MFVWLLNGNCKPSKFSFQRLFYGFIPLPSTSTTTAAHFKQHLLLRTKVSGIAIISRKYFTNVHNLLYFLFIFLCLPTCTEFFHYRNEVKNFNVISTFMSIQHNYSLHDILEYFFYENFLTFLFPTITLCKQNHKI